jgi:hypothetical protein
MQHLLIGDNAFIGISHLSQLKARERLAQLDLDSYLRVVGTAIQEAATGFSFSVHPTNTELLKSLSDSGLLSEEFELYPVLPYAARYVRLMNEKGTGGLLSETLSSMNLADKAKTLLKGGFSAVTFDPAGLLATYLDMELSNILKIPHAKIHSVLLHEVITDLGVSFQASTLFEKFTQHIRSQYDAKPGFVTRNLARFVKFAESSKLSLTDLTVMTPMNRIGFQMAPSRTACESCLPTMNGEVIAMSILAGGFLKLEEAVTYLSKLPELTGVVVGVSTEEHARETFSRLKLLLKQ